jgi:hypothetical protein
MASPADERLLELLDKWLTSLELHTKYSALDDDSYWKIQPWIEHQRPSRWILDLAKQKTIALKAEVEERIKSGDARFSDALELMIFLANLVGSEHIERFIPLAEPKNDMAPAQGASAQSTPVQSTPLQGAPLQGAPLRGAPDASVTGTREMPKFVAERPPAASSNANSQVARVERKDGGGARASAKNAAHAAREQVIADAVRLVQWGREWFELPELVARMADRPSLAEVRRILKENKLTIEEKVKKN